MESLKGFSIDPTIQPYKRKKDDRKAWIALNQQHAGVGKWLAELTKEENPLKQKSIPERSKVDTLSKCIMMDTDIVTFEWKVL